MLLEAPQIWRMKRYNVLETELVYSQSYGYAQLRYRKGTSFSAPQSITEKPMEVYYLDEWIIITLHVAGFLHPAIF